MMDWRTGSEETWGWPGEMLHGDLEPRTLGLIKQLQCKCHVKVRLILTCFIKSV